MTLRDPEKNFETFWLTFRNRYPFFALRGVDWTRQYHTYRPKVTKRTTDDELFQIFCRMLAPLNDGHVQLTVPAAGKLNQAGLPENYNQKRLRYLQNSGDCAKHAARWNPVAPATLGPSRDVPSVWRAERHHPARKIGRLRCRQLARQCRTPKS